MENAIEAAEREVTKATERLHEAVKETFKPGVMVEIKVGKSTPRFPVDYVEGEGVFLVTPNGSLRRTYKTCRLV